MADPRLDIFRRILVRKQAQVPEQQPLQQLSLADITAAVQTGMSSALDKFTTRSGALKISDVQGWKPVGGG